MYDTIKNDFANNEDARAYLAARHLNAKNEENGYTTIKINDPKFVQAIRESVQEFDVCVQDIPTTKMWELYSDFLTKWQDVVTEANLVSEIVLFYRLYE